MSELLSGAKPRELELSVVVIRADGTREDLGTVARWQRNPLKRWALALRHKLTRDPA